MIYPLRIVFFLSFKYLCVMHGIHLNWKMKYHCIGNSVLKCFILWREKGRETERYALAFPHPPRFDWIPHYILCRAASLWPHRDLWPKHIHAATRWRWIECRKVGNEFLNGISFRRTKICVRKYSHILRLRRASNTVPKQSHGISRIWMHMEYQVKCMSVVAP